MVYDCLVQFKLYMVSYYVFRSRIRPLYGRGQQEITDLFWWHNLGDMNESEIRACRKSSNVPSHIKVGFEFSARA